MATKIIIEPHRNPFSIDFSELYRYRELFYTFAERDLKVRYKQTVLGGLWAIIQPLFTMIIFSFFFGKIAKIPSDGIPYPIFSYSGLLLWTLFSNILSSTSNSMLSNAGLISKVYFPRLLVPFTATVVYLVDYIIAFLIVFGLMAYFHFVPSITLIFIPFIVVCTWFLATGIGLWLSAINIKYRDVRYIIPYFLQLLLYATPVIYPASVAGNFKWIVTLNPMSGYIEAHRALILGHQQVNIEMLIISLMFTVLIFISGIWYFRTVERKFVDIM